MARKRSKMRREIQPDAQFNDLVVAKFINCLMAEGKKMVAENIFYGALGIIEDRTKEEGLKTFKKALDNVKPLLEVKSRRVGGATYQVPIEVKPFRRQSLATKWVIDSARKRSEHSMKERLAGELIEAFHGRGTAMKKREDVHRMAEANKAFSHYRW